MITDYLILDRRNVGDLGIAVLKFIEKGWQPLGGVSLGREADHPNGRSEVMHYLQAVVRYRNSLDD